MISNFAECLSDGLSSAFSEQQSNSFWEGTVKTFFFPQTYITSLVQDKSDVTVSYSNNEYSIILVDDLWNLYLREETEFYRKKKTCVSAFNKIKQSIAIFIEQNNINLNNVDISNIAFACLIGKKLQSREKIHNEMGKEKEIIVNQTSLLNYVNTNTESISYEEKNNDDIEIKALKKAEALNDINQYIVQIWGNIEPVDPRDPRVTRANQENEFFFNIELKDAR